MSDQKRSVGGWGGKPQDVPLCIVAAERATVSVAKRVIIRRRGDVVAELTELGDRRTIDRVADADVVWVPIANIGEMSPVVPDLMPVDVVVQTNEPDQAIAALQKIMSIPYGGNFRGVPLTPALLQLDPMFDPLRNDPRFQKLAATMPKAANQ